MCLHAVIFGSSYCNKCVLILQYVCPHTAVDNCRTHFVGFSCDCYICVLIPSNIYAHTAISSYFYMCVLILILLYVCPHTATKDCSGGRWRRTTCVLILLCMCLCVLILLYMCPHTAICMCPHTDIYVFFRRTLRVAAGVAPHQGVCYIPVLIVHSYCYICDLILLYVCRQV